MANSKRKIKAAAYLRMSTDEQDDSPEQQRQQIERVFGERYEITWYADRGISGDRTEHRPQFQRMRDAAIAGSFKAILAWDIDRLSRNDWIEFGYWFHKVRSAGVVVETINQGLVDLNDGSTNAIIHTVNAIQKHSFLRDLSKNVTRGMERSAGDGRWNGGPPPLGFVVGEDKRLHLDRPETVRLVQQLFHEYASGASLRDLARGLQAAGIRRTRQSIRSLLLNPVYLGHVTWRRETWSKYRQLDAGVARDDVRPQRPNDESQWVVKEAAHEAIVSKELFDTVGARLAANRRFNQPSGSPFLFSGLLVCGHCGYKMGGRGGKRVAYHCIGYYNENCERRYTAYQDELLPTLCRVLREKLFNADVARRTREAMRQELEHQDAGPCSVDVLRSQLDSVDLDITRAEKRLVEVSPDMVSIVEDRLRELRASRSGLLTALDESARPADSQLQDIDRRIDRAMGWFTDLEVAVDSGDSDAARSFFREAVDRIELTFEAIPIGTGKRCRYSVTAGKIYMSSAVNWRLPQAHPCARV